jgi:hypothetical protein
MEHVVSVAPDNHEETTFFLILLKCTGVMPR